MNHPIDRRRLIALIGAAGTATLVPAAALAEPVMGDIVLGNADSPVTVIEYASFTCPHCANFHRNTWPQFKAAYIDTGKIRFVFRDVYFDRFGLWASMTARCGGEDAFYPIADQLMKKQNEWARVPEDQIGAEIKKIGRLNGLTADQLNACLSDQEYAKALIKDYQDNATADDVTSTPTFIIGGEKYPGNMSFEELAAIVDAAL